MSEFTIVVDTRENKPFSFEEYPVEVLQNTIETGDYAVHQPDHYGNHDTLEAPFAVERKAAGDFVSSVSSSRERFKREIKRAADWPAPMPIVVEKPWIHFSQGNYYANVHPNALSGTVDTWGEAYNCQFFFRDNRKDAEDFTYEMLKWWDRSNDS